MARRTAADGSSQCGGAKKSELNRFGGRKCGRLACKSWQRDAHTRMGPGPRNCRRVIRIVAHAKGNTYYTYAHGAGPTKLLYGNTRASRAKVDKSCATKTRFV